MRIDNIPDWYFERVVFPREQLVFEAVAEAVLEVYSSDKSGPFLSNRLPCDWLRVDPTQYYSPEPKLPIKT